MSENINAVEVHDVTKQITTADYTLDILKGVNLTVKMGEMLFITGPSGSGKTTLLSILAGTLPFTSGSVVVLGTSLKNFTEKERTSFRKDNIGFIFQQFHLINRLTVAENVSVPLMIKGVKRKIALAKVREMLAKVGLKDKENSEVYHLSGGQQQRVAIARALITEPRLLICDEPTASLDAENGTRIMTILQEVAKSPQRCVIVVTHDARIFKFADRVVMMEDGLITGDYLYTNNP